MKNPFGFDLLRSSNAVMSIVCYPFMVTSCDPVNSSTIMHNMFFRQRFLLASTFLSSSLEFKLALVPSKGNLTGWPTSVAPKSLHSCHHHPSSPPTDVYCHQVLLYLLGSSLPSRNHQHLPSKLYFLWPRACAPLRSGA